MNVLTAMLAKGGLGYIGTALLGMLLWQGCQVQNLQREQIRSLKVEVETLATERRSLQDQAATLTATLDKTAGELASATNAIAVAQRYADRTQQQIAQALQEAADAKASEANQRRYASVLRQQYGRQDCNRGFLKAYADTLANKQASLSQRPTTRALHHHMPAVGGGAELWMFDAWEVCG